MLVCVRACVCSCTFVHVPCNNAIPSVLVSPALTVAQDINIDYCPVKKASQLIHSQWFLIFEESPHKGSVFVLLVTRKFRSIRLYALCKFMCQFVVLLFGYSSPSRPLNDSKSPLWQKIHGLIPSPLLTAVSLLLIYCAANLILSSPTSSAVTFRRLGWGSLGRFRYYYHAGQPESFWKVTCTQVH